MNRGEQYWQRPVPAHPLVLLRPEAGQGPGQPCAKRRPATRLQPARTGTARPRPPQASKQARARRTPSPPARTPCKSALVSAISYRRYRSGELVHALGRTARPGDEAPLLLPPFD